MPLATYLNDTPILGARVFMHASAQIIGDVRIGDDSSIWCNTVLRGDLNHIVIGQCSNVQELSVGHVTNKSQDKPNGSPLVVGDYVTVGHSVILHGCTIGNECMIGMGSIIMDDAIVPDRVMIGAGSLVSPCKVLESGMLYMGRPVKAIRSLTPEEIAHLKYAAEQYVELKNNYLKGITTNGL
jgi:carbonic anhydrase/acetyltransferase-like protein (isoleucine patch superfamily)